MDVIIEKATALLGRAPTPGNESFESRQLVDLGELKIICNQIKLDKEVSGYHNVHYHFKVDTDFIKNFSLEFEWSGLEYFFDTPDMSLLKQNIWLRFREFKKSRNGQHSCGFFILQIVDSGKKDNFITFIGHEDPSIICEHLNKILSQIHNSNNNSNNNNDSSEDSDEYVYSQLFRNDFNDINSLIAKDLLPWCIMYTNRFSSENGFYIDVCKFYEHDHSLYIIGGIRSENFDSDFYNERLLNSVVSTSISKPLQYMKVKYPGLYKKFGVQYEVSNASDNLLVGLNNFKTELNLSFEDLI